MHLPTRTLGLLSLLFLVGCATGKWERAGTLAQSSQVVVELEGRFEEGAPADQGFQHPATISAERLQACLSNIRYETASLLKENEPPPAIDPKLAPGVAHAIAEGLARADGSQRVRFRVYNPDTTLWVLPSEAVTRGVAFIRPEGTFNVAFDLVCTTPDQRVEDDQEWKDPVRWVQSGGTLVLSGGARLHVTSTGKTKRLWVEFPIGPTSTEPVTPPVEPKAGEKTEEKSEEKTTPGAIPVPTGSSSGATPDSTTSGTTAAGSNPGSTITPPPPVPVKTGETSEPLSDAAVLERLRYLEELNRKGLLSDEEYAKERAKLLERK